MKFFDILREKYDKHLHNVRYRRALNLKENEYENYLTSYYAEMMNKFEYSKNKTMDFNNPISFTEKIQWLKLYDQDPRKGIYSDKYQVRSYIKETIGNKYLNDLISIDGKDVFYNANEIDFKKLPNQFVLKCSHASHFNYIVKDKSSLNFSEIKKMKRQLNKWLKIRYAFVNGLELQYEMTKPSIIIEKYLSINDDLPDYKFFCFSGEVKFAWVDIGRFSGKHQRCIFNPYNPKEIYDFQMGGRDQFLFVDNLVLPDNFKEMLSLAEKLCEDYTFARVDLYSVKGKIYFGELTFSSGSGFRCPDPKEEDIRLGTLIKIDQSKRDNCFRYRKVKE